MTSYPPLRASSSFLGRVSDAAQLIVPLDYDVIEGGNFCGHFPDGTERSDELSGTLGTGSDVSV